MVRTDEAASPRALETMSDGSSPILNAQLQISTATQRAGPPPSATAARASSRFGMAPAQPAPTRSNARTERSKPSSSMR